MGRFISRFKNKGLVTVTFSELANIQYVDTFYLVNNIENKVYPFKFITEEVDNCQAQKEECNCRFPVRYLWFNGEKIYNNASMSQELGFSNSYLFEVKTD